MITNQSMYHFTLQVSSVDELFFKYLVLDIIILKLCLYFREV